MSLDSWWRTFSWLADPEAYQKLELSDDGLHAINPEHQPVIPATANARLYQFVELVLDGVCVKQRDSSYLVTTRSRLKTVKEHEDEKAPYCLIRMVKLDDNDELADAYSLQLYESDCRFEDTAFVDQLRYVAGVVTARQLVLSENEWWAPTWNSYADLIVRRDSFLWELLCKPYQDELLAYLKAQLKGRKLPLHIGEDGYAQTAAISDVRRGGQRGFEYLLLFEDGKSVAVTVTSETKRVVEYDGHRKYFSVAELVAAAGVFVDEEEEEESKTD